MDLDHITTVVYRQLQSITGNAHNRINLDEKVTYPYVTFDITAEPIDVNSDGFYIDIDLFDQSYSYGGVMATENNLRKAFKRLIITTDKALLFFEFNSSTPIPTNDETIKRRNIRFYVKAVWREPYGIQRQPQ